MSLRPPGAPEATSEGDILIPFITAQVYLAQDRLATLLLGGWLLRAVPGTEISSWEEASLS